MRKSAWKDRVRERLATGEWVAVRDLFDEVEADIPLHYAFRRAHLDGRPETSLFAARLRLFRLFLSRLKVDVDPPQQGRTRYVFAVTRVRLVRSAAPEDPRERLLSLARGIATLPDPADRRRATAGLIHERFRPQTIEQGLRGEAPDIQLSVEEVIHEAGWPTTDRYWRATLYDPLPAAELVERLAEASATSETDLLRRRNLLGTVVDRYPGNLDTEPALSVARWLTVHPDAEELLHPTLVAYLVPAAQRSEPPSVSEAKRPSPGEALEKTTARTKPPTKAAAQIMFNDMIAGAEELLDNDALRSWAAEHGIAVRRLPELRRNCPDERLHRRGRRPANPG